ncbi:MAG: Asp-tRNA(Asn)/Glu-tRNA(Gln) amidotransferase subunit GatA [Hymenobacteraceae bacterium]|nr:Asp-tRNA(Asn)/Glu-tRNA(Gln) amidotransferase subunit GatA [Hymenobacteraceae bacterium]MDX5394800.1 Asp-tRNA(Asn)/Glu-tRNA(Gln) amidotransferase subunit GatA [Hymenobacteraceae bacterium]MDX5444065.1 Asp-tRNA(Asn)/Glu-tRNA(Gln) amidotransferase subunit GatA [Hymenobacteraceae bacterium]MDX5510830.1 Asp-tRNA(Asn)/Glu-tRNA(Gln) amidotransferase subunit GatA [Hymenobacteraceae bacterium]
MKRYLSLQEVRNDIDQGVLTCQKLVEYYLNNIRQQAHLNAFLEVFEEEALKRADEIDQKIANGTAGRLAGMVVGLKDVLCYEGHKVQSSSQILNGFTSLYTATAVQRLLDEDAIIIGRQNCDEFAMGASNENSSFGNVLNAADTSKVPGGSSGGSAVAVQADMCLVSLGSDTGGSVRQPASFCGVYGLKPTYSRISRYGLLAYASSFDQIGTLTRSVEDAALLLEVIAGPDEYDSTASQKEVPAYSQQLQLDRPLRIGYIRDTLESEGLDTEVKDAVQEVLNDLRAQGHDIQAVDFPYLDYMVPTYYILTTAEASSNLARYDGVKYGHRSAEANNLEALYKKTRAEGFGPEVQRRIILGTFVLSADYYDAYYTKAQKVRRLIKEKTDDLLRQFDFLVTPTAPTTAFAIGENSANPLAMYLADIFTVQASLAGVPAISVPIGEDSKGLPIGLQLLTQSFEEAQLLALSKQITEKIKIA